MFDDYNKYLVEKIWHELGHFTVDLLLINEHKEFKIEKFEFSTLKDSRVGFNKPINYKNNIRIRSISVVSFTMGSIFESVFKYKFLYDFNIIPEKILAFKNTGEDDLKNIKNITSYHKNNDLNRIIKLKINEIFNFILNDESLVNALGSYVHFIINNSKIDSMTYSLEQKYIEELSILIFKDENFKSFYHQINNYINDVQSSFCL